MFLCDFKGVLPALLNKIETIRVLSRGVHNTAAQRFIAALDVI
jgi:hypothetical protein